MNGFILLIGIASLIAHKLDSTHIPIQLLCNTHFCEACDRAVLQIIKQAENSIKLKQILLSSAPELKSFLGKTCLEAAIMALTKIACNDGHKSSLYAEFNDLLERKSKKKAFVGFKVSNSHLLFMYFFLKIDVLIFYISVT